MLSSGVRGGLMQMEERLRVEVARLFGLKDGGRAAECFYAALVVLDRDTVDQPKAHYLIWCPL